MSDCLVDRFAAWLESAVRGDWGVTNLGDGVL